MKNQRKTISKLNRFLVAVRCGKLPDQEALQAAADVVEREMNERRVGRPKMSVDKKFRDLAKAINAMRDVRSNNPGLNRTKTLDRASRKADMSISKLKGVLRGRFGRQRKS